MAFRFWRRFSLFPGVTLNLSKSGPSLSFGPRGAKYTVGPRGRRATLGLPGTGLFYTVHEPTLRSGRGAPGRPRRDPLELRFLDRLTTPAAERSFVAALRALRDGDERAAFSHLDSADDHPDVAWLSGILRLKRRDLGGARQHLERALQRARDLGKRFARYGTRLTIDLPVTPEVTAHVEPRRRCVLLALAEIHQLAGRPDEAIAALRTLLAEDEEDIVARVGLAELLLTRGDEAGAEAVARLAAGIGNDSAVHTALLLYHGRALRRLGMPEAANRTLSVALRRRVGRSDELLRDVRYERARARDEAGQRARARQDFEALFAEAADFRDVARRLGRPR